MAAEAAGAAVVPMHGSLCRGLLQQGGRLLLLLLLSLPPLLFKLLLLLLLLVPFLPLSLRHCLRWLARALLL